jgi:hypothetical protein
MIWFVGLICNPPDQQKNTIHLKIRRSVGRVCKPQSYFGWSRLRSTTENCCNLKSDLISDGLDCARPPRTVAILNLISATRLTDKRILFT